ncbi:MAG: CBS domain-containing protein [Thermoplasmata archaeon]|nr:MAG: CBS domain-containing protein [Thermoplasmata archaeon]
MKVREVMTSDVVTLNEYMSVREAAKILAECNISGAPVLDNDGELVGMLTETDILRSVKGAADEVRMVFPSIHTMGVMFELAKGETEIMEAFEEQANTVVMDVMTRNVITCRPDEDLNKVASVLVKKSINRLPVVDDEGRVVGIVTRGDIVRAFAQNSS